MAGFNIIQERSVTFDKWGKRIESVNGYVKIDENAEEFLSRLKGAPLSFFMHVCLHEPSVCLGKSSPYTRRDIVRLTRYSERALQYAERILIPDFLVVCGTTERGEKMFRPNGTLAWFGNDDGRGAKTAPPTPSDRGAMDCTLDASRGATSFAGGAKTRVAGCKNTRSPRVVEVEEVESKSKEEKTTSTPRPGAREILKAAGMFGSDLDLLGREVEPERAKRWARWIEWAKLFRADKFSSPPGIARYHLLKDRQAEPPAAMEQIERELAENEREQAYRAELRKQREQAPDDDLSLSDQLAEERRASEQRRDAQQSKYRADGTSALWHAVLRELQLQMTKATFDTWVRGARALGWDGDTDETLVVAVRSIYAKEWLENRLQTAVERTATGCKGSTVRVRYEVAQ